MYICMLILTVAFVLRYASKVKKDPTLSLMHEDDIKREDVVDLEALPEFDGRRKAILIVFVIAIIFTWFTQSLPGDGTWTRLLHCSL